MRMNAVLSNPKHPEYGQFTVPLPIPHNQYDGIMEALNAMDMGDPLARDCQMDEILGEYPILKRLEGKPVNIDELDYLAKRLDSFCYVLNSREDFDVVRATLARDSPASDVQKAAWFYELIRYSYAAGLTSFGSQPHDMWSNFPLIEQAHRRLAKVVIENKDFEKLIRQYDRPASLFYLDPPYHATEGYYQNIGEDGFTETDHIRLRDALMRIEGKFLLSYNDDEFIRSLYDRPGIYLMETTRINNIKQRYDNGAQFPELIIANYDMHERLRVAPSQMNLFDLTGGDTAWLKS